MEKPKVLVLNKVDKLSAEALESLLAEDWSPYESAVPISALRKLGLKELGEAVIEHLPGDLVVIDVLLPYAENARLAEFHAQGNVSKVEYRGDGIAIQGQLPRRLLPRFEPFLRQPAEG